MHTNQCGSGVYIICFGAAQRAEMKEIAGEKYVSWQHHKQHVGAHPGKRERGGNFVTAFVHGVCSSKHKVLRR